MGRLQPGIGVGYPGWNPKAEMPGMRPSFGNFNIGPHGFSSPMHVGIRSPNYHPGVQPAHNGFGMSRGVPYGMQFRHSQRMIANSYRPGMPGPGMEGMMEQPGMMGPGPVPTGPGGHMAPLQRPPGAMVQTSQMLRRGSNNTTKSALLPTERKSPKTSETTSKSKKKSEKSKAAQESRSKQNNAEPEKPVNNGADQSLSSGNATPNSAVAAAPKICKLCNNEINTCSDEFIQCRASCMLWFHKTCTGLSDNAYKFLTTEECAVWACDHCITTKEIHAIRPKGITSPLSAGA